MKPEGQGVSASLKRMEDDRFLRRRGQYVGDIKLAGMWDAAFVRFPLARARVKAIRVPEPLRASVFTAADLEGVKPIVANSSLPGFKPSEQSALARDKVWREAGGHRGGC